MNALLGKKSSVVSKKQFDDSPYKSWLEATQEYELKDTEVRFDTIGLAPIDAPIHPVRIKRDRTIAISEGLRVDSPLGCAAEIVNPSKLEVSHVCGNILNDQGTVHPLSTLGVFQACSFFKPCSRRFLNLLIYTGGKHSQVGIGISRGEVVYKKGQQGSSMFILGCGEAEIFVNEEDRRDIGVGAHFGELQMLGIFPQRQETVRAKTNMQLFEIRHEVFSRVLKTTKSEDDEGVLDGCSQRNNTLRRTRTVKMDEMAFTHERRHYEHEAVNIYRTVRAERTQKRPNRRSSARPLIFKRYSEAPQQPLLFMTGMDEAHEPEPDAGDKQQETFDAKRLLKSKGFMNRLIESLQRDKKNGLKVPPDCRKRHMNFMRNANAGKKFSVLYEAQEDVRNSPAEDIVEFKDHLIEVDLLPPMEYLSSSHKRDLAKTLYEDVTSQKSMPRYRRSLASRAGRGDVEWTSQWTSQSGIYFSTEDG